MNQNWQSFLLAEGAVADDNNVLHFPTQTLKNDWVNSDNVLFDLSDTTALRVTGNDAEAFLQSQFSNDISRISADQICQLNAYCNPKGRTIALIKVFPINDDFILLVPCDLVDTLVKRLRMFVMRSKVIIEQDNDLVMIGLAGSESSQSLRGLGFDTPETVNQVTHSNTLSFIRIHGPSPRFIIVGEFDPIADAWRQLRSNTSIAGSNEWALLDILSGQPNVFADTSELFVPQMLNLDHIDGISFTKGCYPGQEIVARMHYLGKLKRRLFLAKIDTDQRPNRGDDLYDEASTQSVGKIVDTQNLPSGGAALLAVIQIKSYKNNVVHLESPTGPALDWQTLPYDVPIEEQ